jgi:N-acetylglutamate synthase-like GNAT family acetyltransferase
VPEDPSSEVDHLVKGCDALVGWFHHAGDLARAIVGAAKQGGLKTVGVRQYYNADFLRELGFEEICTPEELDELLGDLSGRA